MNDCNDLSLFLLWFDKEAYEPKILIFPIPPSVQCADNTCIKHFRNSYRCSASAKTKLKLSSIAEAHAKAAMILVIWIDKKIICSNLLKLVSKTILSKRQFSKDSQRLFSTNQVTRKFQNCLFSVKNMLRAKIDAQMKVEQWLGIKL